MKKVLIVDDEPEIVELVSVVLDAYLSLLTAYDGEEALGLVREEHPDVVVTDVMMPRLDGRELCRTIKSDPEMRHTRVILMTAALAADPRECGADALVRKPFDIHSLVATVLGYL